MSRQVTKLKTLERKLTTLCYEYIFIRDDNICQKCGKMVKGHNRHPSHVIPKSRSKWLRWDEMNIKTLCFYDHIRWWHQNPLQAGKWFDEKFPKRAEYIRANEYVDLKEALTERQLTMREWLEEQIYYYENVNKDHTS